LIKVTDFFCDPAQLEYLVQSALPDLIRTHGYGIKRRLVVLSVGCSGGGEPYTLAMVLSEFSARHPGLDLDFQVLATEAEPDALHSAKQAIYHEEDIHAVPVVLRRKYLLRSKDREKGLVKITKALREVVKFRNLDLQKGNFRFRESMDVIFCRDLLEDLTKAERVNLMGRFAQLLSEGGYLFVGKPQPLAMMTVPLAPVAAAIYRKVERHGGAKGRQW
jgi:chemotaxis protein methyltransferase CheR